MTTTAPAAAWFGVGATPLFIPVEVIKRVTRQQRVTVEVQNGVVLLGGIVPDRRTAEVVVAVVRQGARRPRRQQHVADTGEAGARSGRGCACNERAA